MKIVDLVDISLPDSKIGAGSFGSVEIICGEAIYSNKKSKKDLFAKKSFKNVVHYEHEKSINLYIRNATIQNNIHSIATSLFHDDTKLLLYLEYVPGYTLWDYIEEHKKINSSVSLKVFRQLLLDTMSALNQLHSIGIIHYDLKGNNILVNNETRIVLIDFSLACRMGDEIRGLKHVGKYQPPECRHVHKASSSIDVFSLGVCFVNILRKYQTELFDDLYKFDFTSVNKEIEESIKILTPNDRMLFNTIKQFLFSCVSTNIMDRPNINNTFLPIFDDSQKFLPSLRTFFNDIKKKLVRKITEMHGELKNLKKKTDELKDNLLQKTDENNKIKDENNKLLFQLENEKKQKQELEKKIETEKIRMMLKDNIIFELQQQIQAMKVEENIQESHEALDPTMICNVEMEVVNSDGQEKDERTDSNDE